MPLCQLHNISHRFDSQSPFLFENINLSIPKGQWIELVGANGAGKTTLLKIVAGLLKPLRGQIAWNHAANSRGVLLTKSGIFPKWTVGNALSYWAKLTHASHLNEAIDILGLKPFLHHEASKLSAGWLKRLSYARVLMQPRQLYVLDELWNFLDTSIVERINEHLQKQIDDGASVLYSTHLGERKDISRQWSIEKGILNC